MITFHRQIEKLANILASHATSIPGISLQFRKMDGTHILADEPDPLAATHLANDKSLYDPIYAKYARSSDDLAAANQSPQVAVVRRCRVKRNHPLTSRPEWLLEVRIHLAKSKLSEESISLFSADITAKITHDALQFSPYSKLYGFESLSNFPINVPMEYSFVTDEVGWILNANELAKETFKIQSGVGAKFAIQDLLSNHEAQTVSELLMTVEKSPMYLILASLTFEGQFLPLICQFIRKDDHIHVVASDANGVIVETMQRYSRVLEGGGVAGWDRNIDSGEIYVSQQWRRLFSVRQKEAITFERFRGFVHSEDQDRLADEIDTAISTGKLYSCDYRLVIDGNERWTRATGKVDATGKYFSGRNEDINDAANNAVKRDEQELLLRAVTEHSSDFIFVKDESGRFVFMNQALQRFYNIEQADSLGDHVIGAPIVPSYSGKTDAWFYRGDERIEVRRQMQGFGNTDREAVLAIENSTSIEGNRGVATISCFEEILPPHGSVDDARWYKTAKRGFLLHGAPHVLGISTDITELVLQVRTHEEIFQQSPALMYTKTAEGKYRKVNRAFTKAVNHQSDVSVIGENASLFFDKETVEEIRRDDLKVLATGRSNPADSGELKVTFQNGSEKLFRGNKLRATRYDNETETKIAEVVGIYVDITSEEAAARYKLLEPYIRSLHHDFVPKSLKVIAANLTSRQEWNALEENREKWCTALQMANGFFERLRWLIGIRGDSVGSTSSLSECIKIVGEHLADFGFPNPPVCLEGDVEVLGQSLSVDREWLCTIFFNLLQNAKKYSSEKYEEASGTVSWKELEILVRISESEHRVEGNRSIQEVTVEVDDAGRGLPEFVYLEKSASQIFEPGVRLPRGASVSGVSRLKTFTKGSGFGLFFVEQLVIRNLKGRVLQPQKSQRGGVVIGFSFRYEKSTGKLVEE